MSARRRREGREFMQSAEAMPFKDDSVQRTRALEALAPPPPLKIKLTGDDPEDDPVAVSTRRFTVDVDERMDGLSLYLVRVAVGVVSSSGDVTVMIHNETQAVDMLTAPAGVAAGVFQQNVSAFIADDPDNVVLLDDVLVISIEEAGTDAKGLGVTMDFH